MPRGTFPDHEGPADLRSQAEEMLWEMAFVLHLTQAVKEHLLSEKNGAMSGGGNPLGGSSGMRGRPRIHLLARRHTGSHGGEGKGYTR
jgi:hypothetical protein